ncbi:hypothetical protein BBD42_06065 [Paenibacillus sp. BIHB 4019]|uniref:Signal transduction histidine-protein kinase ArlS n=1 Tax=Paenibacillus sp. BIHB 4019 TaxID=1870819 RepID=A0A1B2DEC9_9BACL|nr:HAMP domain-containing histidine kinase [Paenibacillus sp. BIHB 4019]ANY66071.1 hypothetical protein BBD42_06065 [Paenibacillus sp. BIHB 4019]
MSRWPLSVQKGRLPLKWKLMLGSALMLFLLFAAYNLVQYAFVESWMKQQAEWDAQQNMRAVLNDLLEKERSFSESELPAIRNKLEKINERGQMIRVLDDRGHAVISVSDEMPQDWLRYYPDLEGKLPPTGTWFLEGQLLLMRSPLTIFDFDGTVEIVKSVKEFDKLSADFFRIMLLCCLGAIFISGIGGWLLARQLLRPLKAMNQTMMNVKEKGLQERVALQTSGKDEISALMLRFNEMMDQVERSFEQQKQFVEDASHELRTPVAIIEGQLRMLKRWGKHEPDILEEALDSSAEELVRLKGLVEDLLILSRAEKELPDANEVCFHADSSIRQLVGRFRLLHPEFDIELELEDMQDKALHVSGQHLEQILLILLDNAVKYSADIKKIEISAECAGPLAVIRVIDYGLGIAEADLPHVMDRFYRADKARRRNGGGYGLGLSIAKRLTERYGGSLALYSGEGLGTTAEAGFKMARGNE